MSTTIIATQTYTLTFQIDAPDNATAGGVLDSIITNVAANIVNSSKSIPPNGSIPNLTTINFVSSPWSLEISEH